MPNHAGEFTHAWVSVGMNDYHRANCEPSVDDVTRDVRRTIANVRSAGPPGMRIVLTGYCQPLRPTCGSDGAGSLPETFANRVQAAIGAAAQQEGASFIDTLGACGGSSTSWSSSYFMQVISSCDILGLHLTCLT